MSSPAVDFREAGQPQHSTRRQFRYYNVWVSFLMSLGSFGYGFSASIIATTLAQPSFLSYFELTTRSNATALISTANALFFAGGFLASFLVSFLADRWGRLYAIGVASTMSLIASAGLAGSVHIGMFIAFRFLAGAGGFMLVAAIPIWLNEVSPPSIRGMLVNFHNVGLLFGYAAATWVGYGFYHLPHTSNWAWRGPFIVGALPLALHLIALIWLPESPRFLLMKGQRQAAQQTLQRLHTQEEAEVEILQISAAIEIDRKLDKSWISLIKKPAYRKRSILVIGISLAIQSSGVLVINNYGPIIYRSLGFDTNSQFLYQIGWITLSLGGGFLSFAIIDRVARPKLLAIGLAGCSLCLIIVAALVSKYATSAESLAQPNTAALKAVVAMIYLYILVFQCCLDGTMYAYMGELFPNHIRAKGLVLAIASICAINIMWGQTAPIAFETIGWKFYLCFIIPCALFSVVVWCYYPDTLGQPLEEIARIFGDHEETMMQCSPASDLGDDKVARAQEEDVVEVTPDV